MLSHGANYVLNITILQNKLRQSSESYDPLLRLNENKTPTRTLLVIVTLDLMGMDFVLKFLFMNANSIFFKIKLIINSLTFQRAMN